MHTRWVPSNRSSAVTLATVRQRRGTSNGPSIGTGAVSETSDNAGERRRGPESELENAGLQHTSTRQTELGGLGSPHVPS